MPRPEGYLAWSSMIGRCYNTNHKQYGDYGGRGVKVCDRWRSSFAVFMEDMGPRPSKQHSLDRRENNGDYCPDNCRWATKEEQQNNKRNNRLLTFDGRTMTTAQWARELGITRNALHMRLKRGILPLADVLSGPKR